MGKNSKIHEEIKAKLKSKEYKLEAVDSNSSCWTHFSSHRINFFTCFSEEDGKDARFFYLEINFGFFLGSVLVRFGSQIYEPLTSLQSTEID